jgi:hypothetical protein
MFFFHSKESLDKKGCFYLGKILNTPIALEEIEEISFKINSTKNQLKTRSLIFIHCAKSVMNTSSEDCL